MSNFKALKFDRLREILLKMKECSPQTKKAQELRLKIIKALTV